MYLEMNGADRTTKAETEMLDRGFELELADGTRLVLQGGATPARVEGDCDHAFTLADVQREGGEPFAGYRLVSASSA